MLVWLSCSARPTCCSISSQKLSCAHFFCSGEVDVNAVVPAQTPTGAPVRVRQEAGTRTSSQASDHVVALKKQPVRETGATVAPSLTGIASDDEEALGKEYSSGRSL
jgi:hypothetical protein